MQQMKNKTIYWVIGCLLTLQSVQANDDLDFFDDVEDIFEAPIDDYVGWMLLMGMMIVLFKLYKSNRRAVE
jgi:hypothetical protein